MLRLPLRKRKKTIMKLINMVGDGREAAAMVGDGKEEVVVEEVVVEAVLS